MIPRNGVLKWLILAVMAVVLPRWVAADDEPPSPQIVETLKAVTATLKDIIGDSTVVNCWIVPQGTMGKVRSVPWVEYQLKTPDGKRRFLQVSISLDSEAEAQETFHGVSMIPQVPPTGREYGDHHEAAIWYNERLQHGHILFRRGRTVADIGGDLPLEVLKRQAAALDELLLGWDLPQQIMEAARKGVAR